MKSRDPLVPVTVTVIVGAIPSLDEEIELELDELPAPSFTSPTKSILGRALAANAGTVRKMLWGHPDCHSLASGAALATLKSETGIVVPSMLSVKSTRMLVFLALVTSVSVLSVIVFEAAHHVPVTADASAGAVKSIFTLKGWDPARSDETPIFLPNRLPTAGKFSSRHVSTTPEMVGGRSEITRLPVMSFALSYQ